MIEASGLSKRYGARLAVEGVSFRVAPGRVTGFLGAERGREVDHDAADSGPGHPQRRACDRERQGVSGAAGAAVGGGGAAGRPGGARGPDGARPSRVAGPEQPHLEESGRGGAGLVGLAEVAGRRVKGFSLGMSQRLGIAAALLGDPGCWFLTSRSTGSTPRASPWIRGLLRRLAGEGRTVLVSSHLMSEMQLMADHLLVIGQGRLLADTTMKAFIQRNSQPFTLVRSPQWERLRPTGGGRRPSRAWWAGAVAGARAGPGRHRRDRGPASRPAARAFPTAPFPGGGLSPVDRYERRLPEPAGAGPAVELSRNGG